MKCPECNIEVDDKLKYCPECGAPISADDSQPTEEAGQPTEENELDGTEEHQSPAGKVSKDEPRLGKGMMIFILAGLVFLIGFGLYNYMEHRDDPEYTRTMIEPDSTLADKDEVRFDSEQPDTAAAAEAEKEEKKEAEKVFNSIRKRPKHLEEADKAAETSAEPAESAPVAEPTPAEPAPAPAPTPKIEAIED